MFWVFVLKMSITTKYIARKFYEKLKLKIHKFSMNFQIKMQKFGKAYSLFPWRGSELRIWLFFFFKLPIETYPASRLEPIVSRPYELSIFPPLRRRFLPNLITSESTSS